MVLVVNGTTMWKLTFLVIQGFRTNAKWSFTYLALGSTSDRDLKEQIQFSGVAPLFHAFKVDIA